jgi:predicted ester cyclase
MHRYVHDYTNAHDLSVCDEIMAPDYRIHMGGQTLEFSDYKDMVDWAYARFPDLHLVVHEFITNGDRLAMHFSETATSPSHDGRRGVWEGIGLYRRSANGRLAECRVEQDFYGRRRQLAGEIERPVPIEDPAVWSISIAQPSPQAEATVRGWLAGEGAGDPAGPVVIEDGEAPAQLLTGRSAEVDDMFSAGERVAFRATIRGRYEGGLHGTDHAVGSSQHLDVVGLATVREGRVDRVTLVTDRFGLRSRLRAG